MNTKKITEPEFDWSVYENGYNGKNLVKNPRIKTPKGVKVYSHEHYAEELYKKYFPYQNVDDASSISPKDLIPGTMMEVRDIRPLGEMSVIVDTDGGGSCVIDFNKEREYVKLFNTSNPRLLVSAFGDNNFKTRYLNTHPVIKVVDKYRVSLWEGHLGEVEREFDEQVKTQDNVYMAKIVESNNGGYIVDIKGLKCFMPGSVAAAGIITDFESLIGRTIPVMVVGFVQDKGYIVSYKKYLSTVLPDKVREELTVNQKVISKVTGLSNNGIFVQFNDKDGDPTFIGLVYRDEMSSHMEDLFNSGLIEIGDQFNTYIHSIDIDGSKVRIVLGDTDLEDPAFLIKKNELSVPKKSDKHE